MMIVRRMVLFGYGSRRDTECMVEIEIKEDSLLHDLGNRAFRNASKKSRALGGVIKCSVRPVTGDAK